MIVALLLAAASPGCRAAVTQAAMTACARQDLQRADVALNRQWAETLAFMKKRDAGEPKPGQGPGYAAALLDSQRAWIKYRDAECIIQGYAMRGGSAAPMAAAICLAGLTKTRTARLHELIWDR